MGKYYSKHTGKEVDDAISKIETLASLQGVKAIKVNEETHKVSLLLDDNSGLYQSDNGLKIDSDIEWILDCGDSDE